MLTLACFLSCLSLSCVSPFFSVSVSVSLSPCIPLPLALSLSLVLLIFLSLFMTFSLSFSLLPSLSLSLSLSLSCSLAHSPAPLCLLRPPPSSVYGSPSVSPELPPRYLLGQGQRPNTITHVCWYRNQNLSLTDYLRMTQVPMLGAARGQGSLGARAR